MQIRRTKNGAIHFATKLAPRGNVIGWDAAEKKAADFDEATAGRVLAFYEGLSDERREHIGTIEAVEKKLKVKKERKAAHVGVDLAADEPPTEGSPLGE